MVHVEVDGARGRRSRPLLTAMVGPDLWDAFALSSAFLEPVTQTLMLMPLPLTPDWYSGASGAYTRLGRGDYESEAGSALAADEWIENQLLLSGDIYLENLGVNASVFTAADLPINRPVYLSFYVPQQRGLSDVALECGWGEPEEEETVSLRLFASGKAEVWKGIAQVGEYSISASVIEERRASPRGQGGAAPGQVRGELLSLFLVPIAPRRLLVFGAAGGAFSHTFEDLPQDGLNTVTVAGRFFWRVAQGKASVQMAPLRFAESGYALSIPHTLPEAPPTGATFDVTVANSLPGYGTTPTIAPSLVKPDGSAYTPNGVQRDVRCKIALTGDGTNSAYVGAAEFSLLPGILQTNAHHLKEISDAVLKGGLSVSVPEEPSGVQASLALKEEASLLAIAAPESQAGRPIRIRVDKGRDGPYRDLIVGFTGAPAVEERATGATRRIEWRVRDLWAQMEAALYPTDAAPLDGLTLSEAVTLLCRHAGFTESELDIEESDFLLPYNYTAPVEWNYQPKAGDTPAQWLLRLHKDFASTWVMGWRPTKEGPRFRFRSEADLGTATLVDIWMDRAQINRIIRQPVPCFSFSEETQPPEATRISVYGWDAGTRTFLVDSWMDEDLEDPTLLPEDRPAGWVGDIAPLVIVEPRLTTPAAVTRALDEMVARVGSVYALAEWESPLLMGLEDVPLWRGDCVRVRERDGHVRGVYRILSFSGELRHEAKKATHRRFRYVGKKVAP